MPRRFRSLLLLLTASATTLPAQDPPPAPAQSNQEIAVAAVQARLDAVNDDSTLAADLKTALVEVLGRALESAKATETLTQAEQRHVSARDTAPTRLHQRTAELQAIDGRKRGPPVDDLALAELEKGLLAAQQAQTEAQQQAVALDREVARRGERRTAIPPQITVLNQQLEKLPGQPVEAPDADARLLTARRLALQAERLRLQVETRALAAELQAYDAEVELLRTEGDLAARRVTATRADVVAWQDAVQPLRAAAAKQAESEAQANELRADPRVAKLARGNAELARTAAALVEQREREDRSKADRDAYLQRLQQEFEEVRKRVELVGATDAVGVLLRRHRANLSDTSRGSEKRTRSHADHIADAQLKSFDVDELRRRLVEDPDAWLQHELGGARLPEHVVAEARRLRDARRDLLKQLTDGYSGLLGTLLEAENIERKLGDLIARYRGYVTERVLGIRSSGPLWQTDWPAALAALSWLGDGGNWREAGRLLWSAVVLQGWPLALLLPLLLLLGLRRWLRRRLLQHGEVAMAGSNVAYAPTARALVDTVLLAVPVPGLLWLLGWRLGAQADATEFAKVVAAGSLLAGNSLLLGLVLQALVLPKGLAEAHFRWQSTSITHLRRAAPLLIAALVPFGFLLATLELSGNDAWLGSLGGLLLIGQMALLVATSWNLLHPVTGFIGGGVAAAPTMLHRFRKLWFLVGVGMPAVLLLMVVLGYDYTALQLSGRLQRTVSAILLGVIVHALIGRSLVLERRRLQMRRAQERLQAAKAGEPGAGAGEPADADASDPQSMTRQTQALLRWAITIAVAIAAFQIWVDVLPALGVLRHVELWTGGTDTAPITLADVLLSLFILLAAVAAARNLPAMLELLVLQRLHMQAGERHAVSTLARYGILIVGMVLAFTSIGIGWGKVQWLVAAVSVGLGFGLQEMFANFVSGLILLFERPVRVGDIVTVATTTGRVTRIRMRATTIQDWDRKELIVPNREFVTGHFVNWTLTDSVVRWTIRVSVARGADVQLALRLLAEAAAESRFVRRDPPTETIFSAFGEGTLELQLRVFVDMNEIDQMWLTQLHHGIDQKFRAAGLTIAFPQREVNLRIEDASLLRLGPEPNAPAARPARPGPAQPTQPTRTDHE